MLNRIVGLALLLVLFESTISVAGAQTVPKPNPWQGDGRVSAFYTWDKTIPHKPGTFLHAEPISPVLGLANASKQFRILYSSTNG